MSNARRTTPDKGQRYEVRYRLTTDGYDAARFIAFAGDFATARAAKKTWLRNDTVGEVWIIDRETGKRVIDY